MSSNIDWKALHAKLPYERTDTALAKRKELWKSFDCNGTGYCSLAEVDRGILDVLRCEEIFHAKPAIMRAFQFAKDKSTGDDKYGKDYLEFREFRLFLQTLRQYFEYYEAFETLDTGNDHRINREEFCNPKMKSVIEKWVGPLGDMSAEFDKIDSDHGGQILFKEFVEWSLKKNLDFEDEDDDK